MAAQDGDSTRFLGVGDGLRAIVSYLRWRLAAIHQWIQTPLPARRTVGLLVGDLVVLALFIAAGLLEHNVAPWEYPVYSVLTAVPFVSAWLLVAPTLGAYADRTVESVRTTIVLVTVIWTVASLVGGAIRATTYFHGNAPPSFLAVNIGVGLLLLVPWRLSVAVLLQHRQP